ARTVLARWNREIGETAGVELERALRIAGATGARYAVVGSGVEAGPDIRLTATIYDIADGRQVGDGARVEGSQEEVLALVDALTVEVMRSMLNATEQGSLAQSFRLASLLTASVPALRHYLRGDALFRRARFEEARNALQRAVEEDSTFALAHWRLGETYGWIEGIGSDEGREHKQRAQELAERLPEREATLLALSSAIGSAALGRDEVETLEAYLRRYPDDP
ncbi:MAG: tetratricopeptide repeat protein, partial [Gemmatimonadetes bacterium]|nr:tetratricopeptide repeat protein [Gemmatimonadota bacterium]NIT87466.1 tetratricopeptide repeat protein [Gemmatimonadota bacterium]NIU31327.1 tetratricopeptide repeat protein [Gemmatimonadota bacterium]NIV61680.1 tetratricopeptide repeat protein [Gemmatimonadota bacterium]NIW64393.1 tetratricopeptide repeat protein [Gemmatimonadota bacterium]